LNSRRRVNSAVIATSLFENSNRELAGFGRVVLRKRARGNKLMRAWSRNVIDIHLVPW
jgi:hypothetical protein